MKTFYIRDSKEEVMGDYKIGKDKHSIGKRLSFSEERRNSDQFSTFAFSGAKAWDIDFDDDEDVPDEVAESEHSSSSWEEEDNSEIFSK